MAKRKLAKAERKIADDIWKLGKQSNISSDGIQVSETADENFTYSFADLDEPGFDRGESTTSYTFQGHHHDDDPELREKYPALKDAWDHYNNVKHMCEQKEKEDED